MVVLLVLQRSAARRPGAETRANDVPLDVLVVDMDWHLPFGNDWSVRDASGNVAQWTGYTWNKLLFPEPELSGARLGRHAQGLPASLRAGPYLYTEGRRSFDTGVAFLRPLYYDWPDSKESYTSRGEYQLGENFIVAPVTAAADASTNLTRQTIWLPAGEWIESATGRHLHGPFTMDRDFSLSQVPLYIRASPEAQASMLGQIRHRDRIAAALADIKP